MWLVMRRAVGEFTRELRPGRRYVLPTYYARSFRHQHRLVGLQGPFIYSSFWLVYGTIKFDLGKRGSPVMATCMLNVERT